MAGGRTGVFQIADGLVVPFSFISFLSRSFRSFLLMGPIHM